MNFPNLHAFQPVRRFDALICPAQIDNGGYAQLIEGVPITGREGTEMVGAVQQTPTQPTTTRQRVTAQVTKVTRTLQGDMDRFHADEAQA